MQKIYTESKMFNTDWLGTVYALISSQLLFFLC